MTDLAAKISKLVQQGYMIGFRQSKEMVGFLQIVIQKEGKKRIVDFKHEVAHEKLTIAILNDFKDIVDG